MEPSSSSTSEIQDFQIFVKPAGDSCNLGCSYCYYAPSASLENCQAETAGSAMDRHLLERYISQHFLACRGERVHFSWHGGEPTLLGIDYFAEIVALQRQYCPPHQRVSNAIQTNGTLLDQKWGRFLADHNFSVGISIDGPGNLHDRYRTTRAGGPTFHLAMAGYRTMLEHGVPVDLLCVLHDENVMYPLQVYSFFKEIGARHISFLPLVEPLAQPGVNGEIATTRSVDPEMFGAFLCTVFDQWVAGDIGRLKIQIFEEALRTAFAQEHSLCLFRPTCGEVPVLERNGDLYACDHFVSAQWRIGNLHDQELRSMLMSGRIKAFGQLKRAGLPGTCLNCDVLEMCNGECPKNRFVTIGGDEKMHNYLCRGYRMFFNHIRPFADAVARQWHNQRGKAV